VTAIKAFSDVRMERKLSGLSKRTRSNGKASNLTFPSLLLGNPKTNRSFLCLSLLASATVEATGILPRRFGILFVPVCCVCLWCHKSLKLVLIGKEIFDLGKHIFNKNTKMVKRGWDISLGGGTLYQKGAIEKFEGNRRIIVQGAEEVVIGTKWSCGQGWTKCFAMEELAPEAESFSSCGQ